MENIKDEMKSLGTVAGDNANRSSQQFIIPRDVEVVLGSQMEHARYDRDYIWLQI